MLLGIDFGTTRTVVAAADRGNYPMVSFHGENGDLQEWYPSVVAAHNNSHLLEFGLDAISRRGDAGWSILRSFKRELGTLGPQSLLAVGKNEFNVLDVISGFLVQLRKDLVERSNLDCAQDEAFDALVSVPANANSNQRYLTLEAFRLAGFRITGTLNEPSAAGIEYAHRYRPAKRRTSAREHVVVYDLGGGTFDASVIAMDDQFHHVLASDGIGHLGGDDFDRILFDLALAKRPDLALDSDEKIRLLEECREKKEGLHPNTRKLVIDLGRAVPDAGEVIVEAVEFYELCRPLVEETVLATERSLRSAGTEVSSLAALYMVGGSSDLPVVARILREEYGKLVRRSPYPHAATAIGLAIAIDRDSGYKIEERFTRNFGVWREAEHGRVVTLDVIFPKGTLLPTDGNTLTLSRRYNPAHNLGHFRFVECGHVDKDGQPTGDIANWDEFYFPFEGDLENSTDFASVPISRTLNGQALIEEIYSCDEAGIITVRILNHKTGHTRSFTPRRTGRESRSASS